MKICHRCKAKKELSEFHKGNPYNHCKECQKQYYRNWYATNGRKRSKDYVKTTTRWIQANRAKFSTHQKIKRAIIKGTLIRPSTCTSCGRYSRIYGHHSDYSKPLEVEWMCGSCHKLLHYSLNRKNV